MTFIAIAFGYLRSLIGELGIQIGNSRGKILRVYFRQIDAEKRFRSAPA